MDRHGGTAAGAACLSCAAPVSEAHRFCPQCGTALGAQRVAGATGEEAHTERKQVSVLFVDLCDSTAQVDHDDPEEARSFLSQALKLMTVSVAAYGGTVSQLLGDGLVALFGAPIAQEDHALRACLAGLAMQRAAGKEAAPFVFRVGIHSGEAVVGISGQDLWSHYRADGATIHLAARLEQLARPGSVYISAATQRLVADQMETLPLGMQPIKGAQAPMPVFELSLTDGGSPAAPLARRQSWAPMVGRDDALNELMESVASVRRGSMRVVGIRGEAGVGKSRLAAEWSAGPQFSGFSVHFCVARSYTSSAPFNLISKLVAALLGDGNVNLSVPIEPLHQAAIDDLIGKGVAEANWISLGPTQRRRRVAEAVHWLVIQRMHQGPMLIVLEDIYLADRESLRLLEGLLPRLVDANLLLCVTYRQDFEHSWAESPWFVEHWLAPLHERHMLTLAQAMLGVDPSVAELAMDLVERCDGNPFFVEQLVITLIDDGTLVGTPAAYRLIRPLSELRPPGSIAAVIGSRVDRLAPYAKAAIEAAAVLGEPIEPNAIGSMLGLTAEEANTFLGNCLASGLLAGLATGDGYRFRHGLVQEVLLGSLTKPRRRALHRAAFDALAFGAKPGVQELAAPLVFHAFKGELWPDAAKHAIKAIAPAVSRSANREAMRLFDMGLDAVRHMSDPKAAAELELELLLAALSAHMALGQLDLIFRNLERANAIATEQGDQRRCATVALQSSVFLWMRGRYTAGLERADAALHAGHLAQRRHLQMAAHQTRMMMFHGLGQYGDAIAEVECLQEQFDAELKEHRLMAGWATAPAINLSTFHANALSRLGRYAEAQEVCDRGYRVLEVFDHPYSRGLQDFAQGQMWFELGQLDKAEALLEQTLAMCLERDVLTLLPCVVGILAGVWAQGGKPEQARALVEKSLADRVHDAGGTYCEVFMRLHLATAQRMLGQLDEATAQAQRALNLARDSEQHGYEVDVRLELGLCQMAARRYSDADATLNLALEQAKRLAMPLYVRHCQQALETLRRGAPASAGVPA